MAIVLAYTKKSTKPGGTRVGAADGVVPEAGDM